MEKLSPLKNNKDFMSEDDSTNNLYAQPSYHSENDIIKDDQSITMK